MNRWATLLTYQGKSRNQIPDVFKKAIKIKLMLKSNYIKSFSNIKYTKHLNSFILNIIFSLKIALNVINHKIL